MRPAAFARRLAGGGLLGLPAALLAHQLVFGGSHEAAGALHALAMELGGGCAFLATLLLVIGAARYLRSVVPGLPVVLAGAAAWFAAIELCERAHNVPIVFAIAALLLASWIVRAIASAFAQTVVAIVTALWSALRFFVKPHSARALRWAPSIEIAAHRLRLFSRPPPLAS